MYSTISSSSFSSFFLSCPACVARSSVLSRVFALFGYSATTAEIQLWQSFYTNGCNIRCAHVRKGGQILFKALSHCLSQLYAQSI